MDLGGLTLGVREGVIVLITLVAAYIVVVLLRMLGLRRRPPARTEPSVPPPVAAAPAVPEPPASEPERPAPSVTVTPPRDERPGRGAEEFERQRLEQEVFQLRDEVDALRGELAALRQDMQQELAHLQAAQAVSPIYGDAMQMAAAGYDPAVIA
ncbi:MAG TPA: hypothetical protein VF096_14895, partial [Azonexus sp.]